VSALANCCDARQKTIQLKFQRQQILFAQQALRDLRQSDDLAQSLGEELREREILL
jgi:hypothetical protein